MVHCLYLHRNRENSGRLYHIGYGNAGRNTLTPTEENGSTVFTLEANKEYQIEIKLTSNATTDYCKVNLESKDNYTVQLPSVTLLFSVYASEKGLLTVTPEWGTCAVAGEDNAIANGGKIGTKPPQQHRIGHKRNSERFRKFQDCAGNYYSYHRTDAIETRRNCA